MAVHVRFNSLYISISSSAALRSEMTKFCVVDLYSELNTAFHIQFRGSFDSEKQTKRVKGIARFVSKI